MKSNLSRFWYRGLKIGQTLIPNSLEPRSMGVQFSMEIENPGSNFVFDPKLLVDAILGKS